MNHTLRSILNNFDRIPRALLLPFAFPRHFFKLVWLSLANPRLVGELIEHFPHRKWIRFKNFATLIDVGGFIGAASFAMKIMLPGVKIVAFEPVQKSYEDLIRNMKGADNFTAYQLALGNETGMAEIFQNEFSASSSILELDEQHKRQYPYTANMAKKEIQIARLDDFLPKLEIQSPALLKIDVQGYELEVLKGGENCLNLVDTVFLEVSFLALYKKQCSFNMVHEFLSRHGFAFKGSYDHKYTRNGELIQADLLYCKDYS